MVVFVTYRVTQDSFKESVYFCVFRLGIWKISGSRA